MNTSFDFISGIGFDVHALESIDRDHFIMLCGIQVPCRFQLIAHSDGDVALHALVDAMLGAIGAGDIGEHFPPSDMRWKNADSSQFVKHALTLCHQEKARLVNADITIIGETPKVLPYKKAMKNKLMELLQIDRINIKATTTEKLGFLGRSEGIAAQAVVTMKIEAPANV